MRRAIAMLRNAQHATATSLSVFVRDVGRGLLEVGHNTLALVGLAAIGVLVFALGRADVRAQVMLSLFTDFENMTTFKPAPHQEKSVHAMLEQVEAWSGALAGLRKGAD